MFDFRNHQWRCSAVLTQAFLFLLLIFAAVIAPNSATAQTWTVATDAPFAFTRFDAEFSTTTSKVYFLGGRIDNVTTDGSIWEFDPVTGVYTDTGVDMPVPVSNYNIARLTDGNGDEVLMTFAGRDSAGNATNTVQGYYPASNTTVDLTATDPYPFIVQASGNVEVVNNIAYSFGGFESPLGCNCVHNETYMFDINAAAGSRWTQGPNLTIARAYIGTAVVDGVIYAIGGDTWDGAALTAQTIVEKLDTANPVAWDDASVSDLAVACDENRAFGFDTNSGYDVAGKIITSSCGQWPDTISESMSYDVATNTWDQTFPDVNIARRNHAAAFIPELDVFRPDGAAVGTPGMWIWGGYDLAQAVLATPEYFTVTVVGPTCNLFGDDFEDGVLDPNWAYEKPTWTETGGFLVGTPVKRSARAIASPAFAGCGANCTIEAHVMTAGGPFNKIWLYTFYVDKRNKVELLAKEENDRWVLKWRVNQVIMAKAKAIATIDPNVVYDVIVAFDGTTFTVTVDGVLLITLPAGGAVPAGTVGFQAKNTTGSFGDICVN